MQSKSNIYKGTLQGLSEMQVSNLMLQLPVPVCLLNSSDLSISFINAKMKALLSLSGKKMSFVEIMKKTGSPLKEEAISTMLLTGEPFSIDHVKIQQPNGETLSARFTFDLLQDENEGYSTIIVAADNITTANSREKTIEENEERLRVAMESAGLGTWEYYPKSGALNWSEECRKIYGLPGNKPVTFEIFAKQIYKEDVAKVESAISDALDSDGSTTYDISYRIHRFDDHSLRWIRAQGRVYFNAEKEAERFVGTVLDITKLKETELKIEENEQRLKLAVEASNIGTFEWNIKKSDFILSERLAEIFGYESTVGLNHKSFSILIHPDDAQIRIKALEDAFRNGKLSYEARFNLPNGSTRWIRFNGRVAFDDLNEPVKLYGSALDITDEKQHDELLQKEVKRQTAEITTMHEALKKSEQQYHKMIEEVQDYAIILLDRDGTILNWNRGAENIKGYNESEIVGKNFRRFYTDGDRKDKLPEKLINEAASKGRATHEGWRVRKDGTRFWGSIVITAVHNEEGQLIGFSKVTRDLTEKKLAEDKIREYLSQLELRNKELEQFAYIASHDLQEPLRKIQTFTEIITKNFDEREIAEKYFEKIKSSAQRMAELIRSVLNYSRLSGDDTTLQDVDLNVVLEDARTDFELQISEKNVAINSDKLPVIKGFPLQLHQLFSNLISNAIKFSGDKPVIRIHVNYPKKDELPASLKADPKTKYVQILFSDEGIGFEQKYAEQVFTIFQRLNKKDYPGTGIGLALVKKIVENHKGFIHATSAPGKGTTFHVILPVK
jgi:PAS domain S-box-containing protein